MKLPKPSLDEAYQLSVAPMLDWTDRHCRAFHRILAPHAVLFTEMVVSHALMHGDKKRFLDYSELEHPLVLQVGGSDEAQLEDCCHLAAQWQYDEINLNLGCPSDRVQNGSFGAMLMKSPQLVHQILKRMVEAQALPVSVKVRIGVDDQDSEHYFQDYIGQIQEAGVKRVIVHARKAWLKGLSPKENREIPPLDYPRVERLQALYPDLNIVLNGGLVEIEHSQRAVQHFSGVMIGRAAYHNPWFLRQLHSLIWPEAAVPHHRAQAVLDYMPYIENCYQHGTDIKYITRHMLGLFQGVPGAKIWRRMLTENTRDPATPPEFILQVLSKVET